MLRSLARKVLRRDRDETKIIPVTSAAPKPAPPAPPAAAPVAEPKPAVKVAAANPDEPVVENAEALARMEAGVQEVKERIDAGEPVVLLDVRDPDETAGGVIPGARLIPLPQLAARWKEVEDVNEIVCYCGKGGGRSREAATFLRGKGIFNATYLEGGFKQWTQLGGRTVKGA
ncbi:MAG: rhodanese-like domain-containing protein [Myxococcota bacterium]